MLRFDLVTRTRNSPMPEPFDLHVTFTGLCLLVRDNRNPDARKMHALLLDPAKRPAGIPAVYAHGDVQLPPHLPRLYYNTAHRDRWPHLTHDYEQVALDGATLELSGLADDPIDTRTPPDRRHYRRDRKHRGPARR